MVSYIYVDCLVLACPYAFMPCKNCQSWRLYFASTSDQFRSTPYPFGRKNFPLEQLTRFDALTLQERGICVFDEFQTLLVKDCKNGEYCAPSYLEFTGDLGKLA
ncbi:hypothetical protein P692DRAFT_20440426 [Suillus brevipes Sb2]|nr:hypothetical protein P692DRAFT_20440426 [Suillus brevipes Sb2]